MQEVEVGEAGKIGIEGDEARTAGDGEGGKIGIRPEVVWEGRLSRVELEVSLQAFWFVKKLNNGKCREIFINDPCFVVRESAAEHA